MKLDYLGENSIKKEELSKIDIFDYIVVNDDVIEASEEIKRIIYTQRCNQYRTKIKIL